MQRNSPLLVFIHGGYWRSLDKSDFSWIAPPFLDAGVAVAFLNYGLAPRVAVDDIVRQQLKAIAWLLRARRGTRVRPAADRRRAGTPPADT